MITRKKEFYTGAGLLVGFAVVLVIIFSPVFNGQNGLDYLDGLFNSISKGSAYYIPQTREQAAAFSGGQVDLEMTLESPRLAEQAGFILAASAEEASVSGDRLRLSGDLGRILDHCIGDADLMYYNDGAALTTKYGFGEKAVIYNWWGTLKAMEKALQAQKKFKEAKVVALVQKKAVETAYNYYQIEPTKIGDKIGIVIFALVFYVIYTLWYGFAILYLFEGWGMQLEH